MKNKCNDTTWDFKNENTKTSTHCMHNYPAMMIPQIAKRLVQTYGKKAKLLFDPYCGTGTSLVEANLNKINAIGTDLNPLARLIAKVKTQKLNIQNLDLHIKDFNDFIFQLRFNTDISRNSVIIPTFNNINFWFQKNVINDLGSIKYYVTKLQDEVIKNYFNVAFSETVRETSLTRNSEFKLYRMSEKQINKFNPDVYGTMLSKLFRNRTGYIKFMNHIDKNIYSKVYEFNTCDKIPGNILDEKSVDLIVTSPPYGDSRTTVAYGQFSRLANQWLDIKDANQVDNKLMGGQRKKEIDKFDIKVLDNVLKRIMKRDEKRAGDVAAYYADLYSSIINVSKVVKKNGIVSYVVGNRKVKGTVLPTDEIIVKMFEFNKFKHIATIIRNIPKKRMPKKNSPTNIAGKLDTTMNHEYIVVLKKIA